jgi:cobalt-zinc-cadmium efflux system outer membrane protein
MKFDSGFSAIDSREVGRGFLRSAGLCVILTTACAFAQPRDTLSIARALALVRQHPSLSVLTLEIEARDRQVEQAGSLPNPRFAVEAENFAGTGPFSGTQGLETTARLEQTWELGGKRALRGQQAQAEKRVVESERALKEAQLVAAVRESFSEALRLQNRLRLLDQDTVFLREVVEAARRRAQAGGGGVAEEAKLRLYRAHARSEAVRARAELQVAFLRLSLLMGLATPDFKAVRESRIDTLPEWNTVVQRLENHPDLVRWRSERELRLLSVRSVRAQNVPDLDFNAGVRRVNAASASGGSQGDWALVGGVSVPLPLWNRNAAAVSGAEARARGSEPGAEELTAEAFALWSGLRVKAQEIESLESELMPQAAQVRDISKAAYAQGRYGVLELLDGHKTWLELNEHALGLVAEYRRDAAKLEALTGASHLSGME